MLKGYTYVPRAAVEPCKGKSTEAAVRIYKQFVQHWLSVGFGFREFLVPNLNAWDVHPINATDKDSVIMVLAESVRGPQIILHHNFVGVQFHVNPKYPATLEILRNFVLHMMKTFLSESDRIDLPLAAVTYNRPSERPSPAGGMEEETKSGQGKAVKHSGYAFSMRSGEPLTVRNNATTGEMVKLKSKVSPKESISEVTLSSMNSGVEQSSSSAKGSFVKNRYKSMEYHANFTVMKAADTGLSVEEIDGLQPAWKSKKEIRQMLHPGYNVQSIPKHGTVVPGSNLALTKNDFQIYEKPLVKVVSTPRHYCRYSKEFKHFDVEERKMSCLNKPISLKSLRANDSPYVEPERIRIRELNINREKWISNQDFRGMSTSHGFSRAPSTEPLMTPVARHEFRRPTKDKWIAGCFPHL
jgi:hypothetical protein